MPRPGALDPTVTTQKLSDDLRAGLDAMVRASDSFDLTKAAQSLADALVEANNNQILVVQDPTLPKIVRRARVGLALCLWRQRSSKQLTPSQRAGIEAKAKEAMGDVVRTTTETSVLDTLGPEVDALFQASRKELLARLPGSLTIHVDDPSVLFYVDMTGKPHRNSYSAEKLPGLYHIVALDPAGRSRSYAVRVTPGATTVFDIKWNTDQVFDAQLSEPPRIGMLFRSSSERDREPRYAERARVATGASSVIVVSPMTRQGRFGMSATLYGPGGAERSGFVPLDDSKKERGAEALVEYIVNGTQSQVVEILALHPETAGHEQAVPATRSIPPAWAMRSGGQQVSRASASESAASSRMTAMEISARCRTAASPLASWSPG